MRGYARHRAVALAAVQKAIENGRISLQPDGCIDSELADRQWEQNTRLGASDILKGPHVTEHGSGHGTSPYAQARAERERYAALLAKVEYEKRVAKLVDRDEVKAAAFKTFREFRDRMLNIPDRVAAMIAAETDPAKIHEILAAEVRAALNDFADPPTLQSLPASESR